MKSNYAPIKLSDCKVYLESPVDYDECVVTVEGVPGMLFTLTDEKRDGKCFVEFEIANSKTLDWKISVDDLRRLLAQAEELLVSYK